MLHETYETIILGAAGSIIGGIIISLFIYLYRLIPKYKKKSIVSLYIHTIKRHSDVYANKSLNYLLLIFPLSLFFISLVGLYTLNTTLSVAEETLNRNITISKKIKTKIEITEAKKTLKNLKTELRNRVSDIKNIHLLIRIILIISVLWFYWLILYCIPYNRKLNELTFQYKRLRDFLSTILLKDEKIKLFNQEIQVVDENTLKEYISLLLEYTNNYKINGVKEVMWIWEERTNI